jgi:hypothetical protein
MSDWVVLDDKQCPRSSAIENSVYSVVNGFTLCSKTFLARLRLIL